MKFGMSMQAVRVGVCVILVGPSFDTEWLRT